MLYRTFLTERLSSIDAFKNPSDLSDFAQHDDRFGNITLFGVKLPPTIVQVLGLRLPDKRLLLQTFDDLCQVLRTGSWMSYDDLTPVLEEAMKETQTFPRKPESATQVVSTGRSADIFRAAEAKRRCALEALAVELHRREFGDLPTSLDTVAPASSTSRIDPFSGEPLGYSRVGNSYAVTSIGSKERLVANQLWLVPRKRDAFDTVFEVHPQGFARSLHFLPIKLGESEEP